MARQVRALAKKRVGTRPTTKPGRAAAVEVEQTWQQTKSQNTRTTILDAAIDCFYDSGYAVTTTEQVARRAGVSRGAMLHHFRSRSELIVAAVAHLNAKRLALFEREEMRVNKNARHTRVAEGIDSYWR